jgi:hypothetical protein
MGVMFVPFPFLLFFDRVNEARWQVLDVRDQHADIEEVSARYESGNEELLGGRNGEVRHFFFLSFPSLFPLSLLRPLLSLTICPCAATGSGRRRSPSTRSRTDS